MLTLNAQVDVIGHVRAAASTATERAATVEMWIKRFPNSQSVESWKSELVALRFIHEQLLDALALF